MDLPSGVTAAKRARDWLAVPLRDEIPGIADDALLCLSEVVTNAHRHTSTPEIRVLARITPAHVLVHVRDDRPDRLPRTREQEHDAERGRGLVLLDAYADAWGVFLLGARRRPTGKAVWFEIAVREGA
ncbi:ATP-binding protein [Streptomyces jumonjinensis]|uniref:ATP-binding protein n=1 Tax=Streptomyces jumonjinensis TaxID=1945 RepID=UPI00379C91CB